MKSWSSKVTIIGSLVVPFIILQGCSDSAEREAARQVVFAHNKFAQPIQLSLPCSDPPEYGQRILDKEKKVDQERTRIPTLTFYKTCYKDGPLPPQGVMNFLVENDYAEIEEVRVIEKRNRNQEKRYRLFHHNDRLAQILKDGQINLGSRKLKSVDYENLYDGEIPGQNVATKFYGIRFSYTIDPSLEDMPDVDKVFEGEAELVLNPANGKWVITGGGLFKSKLNLNDDGIDEFEKVLIEKYNHAVPKVRVTMAKETLGAVSTDELIDTLIYRFTAEMGRQPTEVEVGILQKLHDEPNPKLQEQFYREARSGEIWAEAGVKYFE